MSAFCPADRTVLITGASTGIGLELAKLFAQDHCRLILVARNKPKLTQLADELIRRHGISVKVIEKDLARSSAPMEIYEELQRASLPIDMLVNNAGTGIYGPFAESNLKEQLDALQLNILSLTGLTHLVLPMIKSRKGKILNVASVAAFQPGPLMACYFASKAYVLHFSEALANELKDTGVTVTALCPGPTRTDFQTRTDTQNIREEFIMMGALSVAKAGYQGFLKGKTVVVPGLINKILVFLVRFFPGDLVTRVARLFEERTHP
ncbi:MAG: SDR family oxidoreductase [Candidatus Omnitrophica bacterium]|nr:SDR family oxidoreductase [Candidatus Omnitrophota bacterium]